MDTELLAGHVHPGALYDANHNCRWCKAVRDKMSSSQSALENYNKYASYKAGYEQVCNALADIAARQPERPVLDPDQAHLMTVMYQHAVAVGRYEMAELARAAIEGRGQLSDLCPCGHGLVKLTSSVTKCTNPVNPHMWLGRARVGTGLNTESTATKQLAAEVERLRQLIQEPATAEPGGGADE